ncbi:MAG: prepilin-type N-terminal cleavage/methylation domain-containing protein [Mariprofundales bacterium]|nr:prepilin-type N-terminal cleavage/methylation domain-containing protein [Mariprofundales bacterium]
MRSNNAGFTLVELVISMAIGVIVIAGIMGIFVSQSRVQSSEASRIEMIADLQLAGQLIRSELHWAQDIYTECTGKVFYRPMESTAAFPPADCNTVDSQNGLFKLETAANCTTGGASSTTGCICWDRPNFNNCDELIRNIKAGTGLQATSDSYGEVYQVDIYGQFTGADHLQHDLATRITVWPRNQ